VPSPQIIPSRPPTPKIETPPVPEIPSPAIKTETIENEQTDTPNRNIIKNSSEKTQDDTKTISSRVIVNRNVVIAESTTIPNRKVVQGTTNRVVVSSKKITNDSDSDLDDLIEQENDTNKSKS
jgi:hypothetical protein